MRNDPTQCNPGPEEEPGWVFGGADIIFSYSRAQALEDGVLVDVTETAKEAGFIYPVAVTAGLWSDISTIPEDRVGQDTTRRLWDVLFMGANAIRTSKIDGDTLFYRLIMHTEELTYYTVKLVCGPGDEGEPVITLMRPDED